MRRLLPPLLRQVPRDAKASALASAPTAVLRSQHDVACADEHRRTLDAFLALPSPYREAALLVDVYASCCSGD